MHKDIDGVDEGQVEDGEKDDIEDLFDEAKERPEQEESDDSRIAKDPGAPTVEEVEEHRITHYPYRCWCPHCVAGRALGPQHRGEHEPSKIAVIAMDYFYATKDRVMEAKETEELRGSLDEMVESGSIVKCMMVRCTSTKAMYAVVVPKKGPGDHYGTDRVVDFVKWLGHSKIILRSDNEPALTSVVKDAIKTLLISVESIGDEHSAVYDSQSNGAAEVGIGISGGSSGRCETAFRTAYRGLLRLTTLS